MAGGYNTPRVQSRNRTLQDRLAGSASSEEQRETAGPAECWIMPDHGDQPLRGQVEQWTQDGSDWIATIRIRATNQHSQ